MVWFYGITPDPNELYGPWDPFGCSTLAQTLHSLSFQRGLEFSWKIAGGPCHLPAAFPILLGGKLFRGGACEQAGQPEQNRHGQVFMSRANYFWSKAKVFWINVKSFQAFLDQSQAFPKQRQFFLK